jgi:hypothetical protein
VNENAFQNGLKVYPNPARHLVYIETWLQTPGEMTTCLYNINGQLMKQRKLSGNNKITGIIDVSGVPSGIYYLKIIAGNRIEYVKLAVQ